MRNEEVKAHVDLILDPIDKLNGTAIAKQLKGEKVDPWAYTEEDFEFLENIKAKFREEYGVEE